MALNEIEEIKAARPEILLLQEYTHHWHAALQEAIGSDYPHVAYVAREDSFGAAIYSRRPFVGRVRSDLPLGRGLEPQIRAVVRIADREVAVYNVHLLPPWGMEYTLENRAQIAVGQHVHLDMDGAEMTGFAFDTTFRGLGKYMVCVAVCLFGFSTMISWSYYGEKGAEYLLGPQAILPYKFIFVIFVFLGMVLPKFQTVYDFSDATTGLMVLWNLPAVLILSPVVLRAAKDYFHRLDTGQGIASVLLVGAEFIGYRAAVGAKSVVVAAVLLDDGRWPRVIGPYPSPVNA